MSYIPRGRSVGQKGGRSEGPGHSGPIQTDPESSVRCRQGISARDRNSPDGAGVRDPSDGADGIPSDGCDGDDSLGGTGLLRKENQPLILS